MLNEHCVFSIDLRRFLFHAHAHGSTERYESGVIEHEGALFVPHPHYPTANVLRLFFFICFPFLEFSPASNGASASQMCYT